MNNKSFFEKNKIYNRLNNEVVFLSKKEKFKKRLFIDEKEKIILFAGRLNDIKGVCIFIKVFKGTFKNSRFFQKTHIIFCYSNNYMYI